jgi:Na+-driven multidrug efflux pump
MADPSSLSAAGAAMSTFVAIAIASVWLTLYFLPADSYLRFVPRDWRPDLSLWKKMLNRLPAGAEFGLLAVYLFIVC